MEDYHFASGISDTTRVFTARAHGLGDSLDKHIMSQAQIFQDGRDVLSHEEEIERHLVGGVRILRAQLRDHGCLQRKNKMVE
jgi:hypothetical protein